MIKKYLFIGLLLFFTATSIFYTVEVVASGAEISSLEKTKNNLIQQKTVLEDSFIKSLSINKLQEKSIELGFTKPASVIYVSGSEPVTALR